MPWRWGDYDKKRLKTPYKTRVSVVDRVGYTRPMRSRNLIRLEWISLVYLALFVFAVLSPSLVTKNYLGLDERHVEEVLIFLFGIVGLGTFSIYQRLMEKKEKEHESAKMDYERAKRELVESYSYIGSINRKIEVLKKLANETSLTIVERDKRAKDLYSSLVASAATSVGSPIATLRVLHLERLRTELEVHHTPTGDPIRISNKELKKLHDTGAAHAFLPSENGGEILVVPSGRSDRPIRAFICVTTDPSIPTSEIDTSLLGVFANQAELLHYSEAREEPPDQDPKEPLDLVRSAQRQVIGEVR